MVMLACRDALDIKLRGTVMSSELISIDAFAGLQNIVPSPTPAMSISTVSTVTQGRPTLQPFQCSVCQCRFTRQENLKRHAVLHTRTQDNASLSCEFCNATFSRSDLRHRHMKRKHLEQHESEDKRTKKRRQRTSHTPTQGSHEWRSQIGTPSVSPAESPDSLDIPLQQTSGQEELDSWISSGIWPSATSSIDEEIAHFTTTNPTTQQSPDMDIDLALGTSFPKSDHSLGSQTHHMAISQPSSYDSHIVDFGFGEGLSEAVMSIDTGSPMHDAWFPSNSQIARGCQLFFKHCSHFVPFLHQPTFDTTQTPTHLLLSMLCLGYQYGEDPEYVDQTESGPSLSLRCFQRARLLIASDEKRAHNSLHNITMVQAYLVLQICSMLYFCGEESTYGLKTHSKMISLARAGGLMQSISIESGPTEDLDSLWRQFIKDESLKRTIFAVHQLDALWYQFLSIPRSLSHLEIRHDLPCPEDYWTASSSAEWAHRRLIARDSGLSMGYPEAVRRFLSADSDLSTIPAFDAYGAINITQFLVSSAREVSGWSTMTGMLSMERLQPLRSSLLALRPFIISQAENPKTPHVALCEATWEIAMVEMQMWSPLHTGGIVERSIDAVLHHLTYLAPSSELLCEPSTAKSIQPHVDWFLRYLDQTSSPDSEAPWITMYAYKAFMIAWQLMRGSVPGALQAIDIEDGDAEGAIVWARRVFGRRERWQLGKIIMACLDTLER